MRSRPADACSAADSGVSSPASAARPARSGCARTRASCSWGGASRTTRANASATASALGERAEGPGPLRHPGRALGDAPEPADEGVAALLPAHPIPATAAGVSGTRGSSRPVASRTAATTAGVEAIAGISPTPLSP